jgi:hypothetical protein
LSTETKSKEFIGLVGLFSYGAGERTQDLGILDKCSTTECHPQPKSKEFKGPGIEGGENSKAIQASRALKDTEELLPGFIIPESHFRKPALCNWRQLKH